MSQAVQQEAEQLQVDAFTSKAFGGNPAAVVFEHRGDQWMQVPHKTCVCISDILLYSNDTFC